MKKYKNLIIILLAILTFCISICFIPIDATKLIPTVETQVSKDLGVKIHIDRLILRLGPSLKVKAPVMHIMYEDGHKFGQFNNVKFFISWSSLIKDNLSIKRLYADKFIIKIHSNDEYLQKIVAKINDKNFNEVPNLLLKNYSFTYIDCNKNKVYKVVGSNLDVAKIVNYENFKIKSNGEFFINDKKYLSYDVSILPNLKIQEKSALEFERFFEQMEELDFYSDIIADLKFYNDINGNVLTSGLVNIDNISVLDPGRKSPKSFIYLTFLGDKIGINSNIYASNDKKVYIDGIMNNSSKRSLEFKVKTDDIELNDLYKKIKLLANFSKFKAVTALNGKLKADFTIKGDINKIKSSGYLKISDASIKTNNIDVDKISSNIDFSNNIINITDATGYVNNAPIMAKGKIDKNIDLEFLMNKVELKYLCPVSFGIKDGTASIVAHVSGPLNNVVHTEKLQIENFKCVNNANSLSFSTFKIDTNKENIAYISNVVLNSKLLETIKLPFVKLYVDRDSIKMPTTNIFMPNSKLKAKAEITNYNSSKNLTFNLNAAGQVHSRDVKRLPSIYGAFPVNFSIYGNQAVQNILAQILMEKAVILDEPAIVNLAAKIENNNAKIEDLSVSSFTGKFSDDFKTNLRGQKKIIVSGNIDNLLKPAFKNIRVFIPQQLNITYLDTIAQLKGDIFINGNYNKPDIVGQISVQNIINQFLQLAIGNVTLDFNKTIAVINAPQVKISDSVMGLNASIIMDFSNGLIIKNANVKSKYVDTDTFLMYKDSPLFKHSSITINDGKFYSEKALANIYNSPLHLSALTTDFNLKNNILKLNNLSSELYNGKLAGNIEFNLKDEHFKSNIQGRGISASPIFDLISTRKDSVSGSMDFDTSISGNLTSKQSLNGNIKFIVHNGRMGTLGKLEHLLYAQNVIADNMLRTSLSVVTKAITLKDTGLFKYLRGDVNLQNGIAHVNLLQSQGPLMSLFIRGTYHPDTDYAKLVVLGRLSDEIISGLGAFGDFSFNKLMVMLTGEDCKDNILPEDIENLPQLPMKNTKEFRSVINGILDKPSSVLLFNWISYSEKSYKQKDVPMTNIKVPDFIDSLPY